VAYDTGDETIYEYARGWPSESSRRKAPMRSDPLRKRKSDAAKPDPIFRLIRDHEAACAAYEPKRNATADMLPSNPRYQAAEAAESRANDREMKAALAVLGCQPTTLMGVLALLEHVSRPEWLTKVGSGGTRETILSGMHDCSMVNVKSAARQFPFRLAAALRNIIERGQA
jgi:hypothetical protein